MTDAYAYAQSDGQLKREKIGECVGCLKCDTPFVVTGSECFPKNIRQTQKRVPQAPAASGRDILSSIEQALNTAEG